jgi:glycosyltransferase involved in cell wall biosynthesis
MRKQICAVGVVIAVRDGAPYLARAIGSVLAQQPAPMDVLVVDGDSTDDSAAIARSFPGVRVIGQRGRGLGSARNQGVAAVKGDIIAFCDADDRWSADSLARRLDALAAHPAACAVIGRVVLEPLAGSTPTAAQRTRIGRPVPGFTPGALLVRRAAFTRIGRFDEELRIGSDSDWFVRLQQSSWPSLQIDAVVLHKGARGNSLSTDVAAYRRELLTVARRFVDRRRTHPAA